MNHSLSLKMVLTRLRRYKLKAFFMMLGIIISVMAIVLVTTVGANIRVKFTEFINKSYPADTVYLAAGNGFMGGGEGSNNLKVEDVKAIVNSVDGVKVWDPIIFNSTQNVTSMGHSAYVAIMGHSQHAEYARNRTVIEGDYFSEDDIRRASRVALIGQSAAKALFGDDSPVGQQVFYNNITFDVIGVLESAGVDPHGRDRDNELHFPYTILKNKILRRNYISGVTFVLNEEGLDNLEGLSEDIVSILRERHSLGEHEGNDFTLINSSIMKEMVDKAYRTFDIFVPLTTGIAFLISGIVILNIMLISIKERTAEIGLRKALGAKPIDLKLLVLMEVLIISIIASVIGVLFAQLIIFMISPIFLVKFGIESLAPSFSAIGISIALAMAVGILGALVPAQRAAKLNPVTALQ